MKQNGFSLIEVIIGAALFSMLALALAQIVTHGFEGQRSVQQRQAAAIMQLRTLSLLGDRSICEINFRNLPSGATNNLARLLSATGPEVVAFETNQTYEDKKLKLTGMKLQNYRPYATTGKDQYRGTLELTLTLRPEGQSLGTGEMVRSVMLVVELNGFESNPGVATSIRTCASAGTDIKNIWTLKSNGDIYYTGFKVGIGTSTPSQELEVKGNVIATGYLHSSDERLKRDIVAAPGLAAIERLRGVRFVWRNTGRPALGVIAQNVESVLPDAVVTDPRSAMKAVAYDQLIGPLIESVKELARENRELEAQVRKLESK